MINILVSTNLRQSKLHYNRFWEQIYFIGNPSLKNRILTYIIKELIVTLLQRWLTMIEYHFDSVDQIMYVNFSGTITFEELLDHVSPKENRQDYPKFLKILTNARSARLDIKHTDLYKIRNQLLETIVNFDKVFDAFVVEGPLETALSMMYTEIARNKKYDIKVFSDIKTALHWLKQQ